MLELYLISSFAFPSKWSNKKDSWSGDNKCRALMHASSIHPPNLMPVLPLKEGHFQSLGTKMNLSVKPTVGGVDEVVGNVVVPAVLPP